MDILNLLSPEGVIPRLHATSKKQALQELAKRAAAITHLPERQIFDVILERERLGTTGVGGGIAIPHGRLPKLERIYGIFARLEQPIDFESIDEQPVDLIFMLLAPEAAGADHLKALARVSRMLRDRATTEKLHDFAFRLARKRKARGGKGKVTCVDKANVFKAMAFFRKIFDERAALHPDIEVGYNYVDAQALDLIRRPWDFDVLVMENIFGDILSDLSAALVGGMGMAPSGDIGDAHGLFQPAHGTAPDIAGKGIANPTAMILSAAMMLDWLGERHGLRQCVEAAALLERAVDHAFATRKVVTPEFGGKDGTAAVTRAVIEALEAK